MNKSKSKQVPNPGSKEALDMGCKCPVMDNHYGRGWHGIEGTFVYNASCDVHKDIIEHINQANNDRHTTA